MAAVQTGAGKVFQRKAARDERGNDAEDACQAPHLVQVVPFPQGAVDAQQAEGILQGVRLLGLCVCKMVCMEQGDVGKGP